MPRIIDDSQLAAVARLRRLQILGLLAGGALLGAGLQALPPLSEALAQPPAAETRTPLPDGEALQLRMDPQLGGE